MEFAFFNAFEHRRWRRPAEDLSAAPVSGALLAVGGQPGHRGDGTRLAPAAANDTYVRLNVQGLPVDVPRELLEQPRAGLLNRLADGSMGASRDRDHRLRLDANPAALSILFYALRHGQVPRGAPIWLSDMAAHEADALGMAHLGAEFRLERLAQGAEHGVLERLAYADALFDLGREAPAWAELDRAHLQAASRRCPGLVRAHYRRARQLHPGCLWRWVHCDLDDPGALVPPETNAGSSATQLCARARWLMAPEARGEALEPRRLAVVEMMEDALAKQPQCVEAAGLLAAAHLWLSLRGDEARRAENIAAYQAALGTAISWRPESVGPALACADQYLRASPCVLEALKLYTSIHRLQPDNAQALIGLGLTKGGSLLAPRPDGWFRRARLLDPEAAARYAARGRRLLDLGELEPAALALRVACRLAPDQAGPPLALAELSLKKKDPWRALPAVKEAKRRGCTDKILPQLEAEAHLGVGDLERAVSAARRAVALDPTDHLAHKTLGAALLCDGDDLPLALDAFETSLRLCPGDAEAREHIDKIVARLAPS